MVILVILFITPILIAGDRPFALQEMEVRLKLAEHNLKGLEFCLKAPICNAKDLTERENVVIDSIEAVEQTASSVYYENLPRSQRTRFDQRRMALLRRTLNLLKKAPYRNNNRRGNCFRGGL